METGHNDDPAEIGIRELRDRLSKHIARVREGATITVTDHGTAVAQIVPMSGVRPIDRLIGEGIVTPARAKHRVRPRPGDTSGTVSDLVTEQRR